MGKMELEVKVLNINEEKIVEKIENLGGKLKEKSNQYLYTYDLPTIYSRYVDILYTLNNSKNDIQFETNINKLKLLFFELDNLLTDDNKIELKNIIGFDNLSELLKKEEILKILNNKEMIEFVQKFQVNHNKWIRLRKTNNLTTLTIKHILADNGTNIQQMLETEIEVPSLKDGNDFLEALGYSHKSYQEKKRLSYILMGYEIDIDTWPGIPTYMEVEGKDEEDLNKILNLLGYNMGDTVSCTADEIYEMYGKNIFDMREIKF